MEQIPNPEKQSYTVPVLAMRGLVALPQTTLFVDIGRKQSVAAVRLAAEHYKYIFLTAQKNRMRTITVCMSETYAGKQSFISILIIFRQEIKKMSRIFLI